MSRPLPRRARVRGATNVGLQEPNNRSSVRSAHGSGETEGSQPLPPLLHYDYDISYQSCT
jgi:hypothetical protein